MLFTPPTYSIISVYLFMKIKKICFYFPYHEDSGVPVLFYRMANTIAQSKPNLEIFVIDYIDGAMARHLMNLPNLKLIAFSKKQKVTPPNGSILIMQTFVPYYWPEELKLENNQKIFFWNLHPRNLIPSLLPIPFFREIPMNNFYVYRLISIFYCRLFKRLKNFLMLLVDTKSIYFMDKTNLDFTSKYLFTKINNRQYLPVPATNSNNNFENKYNFLEKDVIQVGWIGRLCDFKSHILIYTIKKIDEIAVRFKNKKFIFHIVGDGPLINFVKKQTLLSTNISIVFHGSLNHEILDEFIKNNFDIMVGMGTSALEGAKNGKPTILLDASYKKIKNEYVFDFLYNRKEFDLAHFITKEDCKKDNDSLFNIINQINANYQLHSIKSKEYFEKNHDINSVISKFLEIIADSRLEFSMIDSRTISKGFLLTTYNKIRKLK